MAFYALSPEALDDLLRIQEFIASDSPRAAEKVIEELFSSFEHLAKWPRSGHLRNDLTGKDVLFWPVGSYLVVYRLRGAESLVQIVAVLLAARDVPGVLEDR